MNVKHTIKILTMHISFPKNLTRTTCKYVSRTCVKYTACCQLSGPVRHAPPYRARPFRTSIAEDVWHSFCLVFMGHRTSIAEIPLWYEGIASQSACYGKGYSTQSSHVETPKYGGIAEIVSQ